MEKNTDRDRKRSTVLELRFPHTDVKYVKNDCQYRTFVQLAKRWNSRQFIIDSWPLNQRYCNLGYFDFKG